MPASPTPRGSEGISMGVSDWGNVIVRSLGPLVKTRAFGMTLIIFWLQSQSTSSTAAGVFTTQDRPAKHFVGRSRLPFIAVFWSGVA
jgi:hypothetical protein